MKSVNQDNSGLVPLKIIYFHSGILRMHDKITGGDGSVATDHNPSKSPGFYFHWQNIKPRSTERGFINVGHGFGTVARIRAYLCASIFLTKLPLGCAPTNLSTTWPPLIKRMAGIEVMP